MLGAQASSLADHGALAAFGLRRLPLLECAGLTALSIRSLLMTK
jgi:hypothetical protein